MIFWWTFLGSENLPVQNWHVQNWLFLGQVFSVVPMNPISLRHQNCGMSKELTIQLAVNPISTYGGVLNHGGTPKSSSGWLSDLVLKPVVFFGSPFKIKQKKHISIIWVKNPNDRPPSLSDMPWWHEEYTEASRTVPSGWLNTRGLVFSKCLKRDSNVDNVDREVRLECKIEISLEA